jgi:hypothetical protein
LDQSEVEKLVEELEVRVERLRALYDQYFMGIEKIEPAVPRKDVERRLYVLRRTQIRNTGLRFRFHNALLRFNTYQTYWMRICRQIEEGTYKRDVRRANARFAPKPRGPEEHEAAPVSEVHDTEPPGPGGSPEDLGDSVDVDFESSDDMKPDGDWLHELQMQAVLRPAGVPGDLLKGVPPSSKAPPTTRKSTRPSAPRDLATTPAAGTLGGGRYVQAGRSRAPSEVPVPARPPPRPLPPPAPPPPAGAHSPTGVPPKKKSRPSMPKIDAPRAPRAGPPPAPPRPAPRAAKEGHLSEERVRQIYTQYVDTKRSLKESTASITYESLSKSLQDSTEKLRQKHTGRSVDFEVTIKDGRTILRPIVK